MKKVSKYASVFALLIILTGPAAQAHYGMIIPSDSMVMQKENRTVTLKLSFSHPFEGIGMELEKPGDFTVIRTMGTPSSFEVSGVYSMQNIDIFSRGRNLIREP